MAQSMASRPQEEVSLRFLAPASPNVLAFFVVFYGDAHFGSLVAVQLVEVQGLRTERIRLVVGQSIERSICASGGQRRKNGAGRWNGALAFLQSGGSPGAAECGGGSTLWCEVPSTHHLHAGGYQELPSPCGGPGGEAPRGGHADCDCRGPSGD
eukprot:g22807.t1